MWTSHERPTSRRAKSLCTSRPIRRIPISDSPLPATSSTKTPGKPWNRFYFLILFLTTTTTKRILIGAPLTVRERNHGNGGGNHGASSATGSTTGAHKSREGAVYRCRINVENSCYMLPFDKKDWSETRDHYGAFYSENKTDQLLGATLLVSDDVIMVKYLNSNNHDLFINSRLILIILFVIDVCAQLSICDAYARSRRVSVRADWHVLYAQGSHEKTRRTLAVPKLYDYILIFLIFLRLIFELENINWFNKWAKKWENNLLTRLE